MLTLIAGALLVIAGRDFAAPARAFGDLFYFDLDTPADGRGALLSRRSSAPPDFAARRV